MLTTQDLKQIKTIVHGEISGEISPIKKDIGILRIDVDGLKKNVGVLRTDVSGLKKDVSVLRVDVDGLKKDMKVVKRDLSKVKSDLKVTIEFFDKDLVRNKKRIERVENHLGLPVIADF